MEKLNVMQPAKDLWQGRLYMHTAFWLAWFTPMMVLVLMGPQLSFWTDIVMIPYLAISTVGAWRSTSRPPGRLWVASLYRLALFLFGLTVLLVVGMMTYWAIAG